MIGVAILYSDMTSSHEYLFDKRDVEALRDLKIRRIHIDNNICSALDATKIRSILAALGPKFLHE